jgi:hypothetical protein
VIEKLCDSDDANRIRSQQSQGKNPHMTFNCFLPATGMTQQPLLQRSPQDTILAQKTNVSLPMDSAKNFFLMV